MGWRCFLIKNPLCQNWLAGFSNDKTFAPKWVGGIVSWKNLCAKMGWRVFLMKELLCQNWLAGFPDETSFVPELVGGFSFWKQPLCQNWLAGFSTEKPFVSKWVGGVFLWKNPCAKMGWWGFLMKNKLLYDQQQKSSRTTFSYRTLRNPTKPNTEPDIAR